MTTGGTGQMLLVEDNPHDLELAMRTFGKAGVAERVQFARDGAEALDRLFGDATRPVHAESDNLGLVVLDLHLPKVDGQEILRRIKSDARTKHIPVVVLTSSHELKDVAECYRLGANSYVIKPVSSEEYALVVRTLGVYWLQFNHPPK